MALLQTVCGTSLDLLEDVTRLNTLVHNVWLIPCQRIVGEGKDWPFDEHFDFLLELANHGEFHAN